MDVFCDGTSSGFIIGNETISFRFNMDQQQDIHFVDTDYTFIPILKLKNSVDRYVANEIAADCNEWECDGMSFTIKSLSRGMYTVQLLPVPNGGNATNFRVNMICSNGSSSGIAGTVRFSILCHVVRDPFVFKIFTVKTRNQCFLMLHVKMHINHHDTAGGHFFCFILSYFQIDGQLTPKMLDPAG